MAEMLDIEFREAADDAGGLTIELWVEDELFSRAQLSAQAVHDLESNTNLNLSGEALREALRRALYNTLLHPGLHIEILGLHEERALRFVAAFIEGRGRSVTAGVVWYDVQSGTTGPENVSHHARNMLRTEAHRALIGDSTLKRFLFDAAG